MYVITGATGHTGSIIAKRLLAEGKQVRVIGRSAARLDPLVSLGAEPFVADVKDEHAMAGAFREAKAAFVMLPPDMANPDYGAYQNQVTSAIASALETDKPSHVVALSSFGADKPDKTGPIAGTHRLEERLKRIPGLNALFLRAGYFMENTLAQVAVISQMGATAGPLRPDLKIAMIATRDIGAFAAEALLALQFRGYEAQELLGQRDLTMTEAAAVIGKAIGKPDLPYVQISYDDFHKVMMRMGASARTADLMVEMAAAQNSGHVRPLESRSARNTTATSYEEFVADTFVPAFRASSAGSAQATS